MAFPKIDGYVVTEKLGSGSYSTVYKAYNKVGGRERVAIKCVARALVRCGAAVDNLVSEIRLLKALRHPHIVRMHDFTWDQKNIYIITELCNGGDLSAHIRRRGRLTEAQARHFIQQLVSALKYLHENGVSHHDLKPHNLLLQRNGDRCDLKLADFGFAMRGVDAAGGVRGSPLYMAPEGLAGRAGPAADLWSLGVVFYECMFGSAPYASSSLEELLQKVQREDPITIPENPPISPECKSLLRSLLQHDPARRITHEELFNHPYLDLEHMPSDENYAKGARALHEAACAERAGRAGAALAAYRAGLGLLTPCAARVTDPVRREHLTRKLARYMDRAEQIKQYLKDTGQELPDESEYWKEEAREAARRTLVNQDAAVTSVTPASGTTVSVTSAVVAPATVTSATVTPATVTSATVTPVTVTSERRPELKKKGPTINNRDTRGGDAQKGINDTCRIT